MANICLFRHGPPSNLPHQKSSGTTKNAPKVKLPAGGSTASNTWSKSIPQCLTTEISMAFFPGEIIYANSSLFRKCLPEGSHSWERPQIVKGHYGGNDKQFDGFQVHEVSCQNSGVWPSVVKIQQPVVSHVIAGPRLR